MECRHCQSRCIKKGIRHGSQQYRCTTCRKYQKKVYRYHAHTICDRTVIQFVKEGVGIRSMSRLLRVAVNTVLRRIRKIATRVIKPPIATGKVFEVDEMCTFIGHKSRLVWIILALNLSSGTVVDFYVGPRTAKSLRMVTNTLVLADPKRIYTDKLTQYTSLIPPYLHSTKRYWTNHVERDWKSLFISSPTSP